MVAPHRSLRTVLTGKQVPLTGPFGSLKPKYFAKFNGQKIPEAFSTAPLKIFYITKTPPRNGTIEPNVSLDYLGNPIWPSMNLTDNDRSSGSYVFDDDLDYKIYAKHPTDSTRNGVSDSGNSYAAFTKWKGGRRVVIIGWDSKGYPITYTVGNGSRDGFSPDVRLEGFRGDYALTVDADFVLSNGMNAITATGDGTTTAFSVGFAAKSAADVIVQVGGVTVTTGFTVTRNAYPGIGVTVTFAAAPANGASISFIPVLRPTFGKAYHVSLNQHGNNRDGYTLVNTPSSAKLSVPLSGIAKTSGFSTVTISGTLGTKSVAHGQTGTMTAGRKPLHNDYFLVDGSTFNGQVRNCMDGNWKWNLVQYVHNSGAGKISMTGRFYDTNTSKEYLDVVLDGSTTAPKFTFYGTWAVGNTIDLYVTAPDMTFVKFSYTVPNGGTSWQSIANALRALIAADGRFSASTVTGDATSGYSINVVPTGGEVTPTKFMVSLESGGNLPAGNQTITGGTAYWFTQDIGTHADGSQYTQTRYQGLVMEDRCTYEGNYDGLVFANGAQSDCVGQFTRINYRFKYIAPCDPSSGSFRLGYTSGIGAYNKYIADCYIEPRPLDSVAKGLAASASGGEGVTITLDGIEGAYMPGRPEIKGVFKLGPPPGGDFAPYSGSGPNFVHPGESDVNPTAGTISDINFYGLTSISEDIVPGAPIGLLDAVTDNNGGDIDYTLLSSNVSLRQFFLHGRRVVHSTAAFDYASTPLVNGVPTATVTVKGTIRGSNPVQSFTKTLSFGVAQAAFDAWSGPFNVTFEGQKAGTGKSTNNTGAQGSTTVTMGGTMYGSYFPGMTLTGTNVPAGAKIVQQLTSTEPGGALGGRGNYQIDTALATAITNTTITGAIAVGNRYVIPYTLTAAAAADRVVMHVINVRASANRTITAIKIGGFNATLVASKAATTGTNYAWTYIYQAVVPTGSNGDLDITFSGGINQVATGAFSVVGGKRSGGLLVTNDFNGGSNNTARGDANDSGSGVVPMPVSVPAGGVIIGGQFFSSLASGGYPTSCIAHSAPAGSAGTVNVSTAISGTVAGSPTLTWTGMTQDNQNVLFDGGGGPTTLCFVAIAPHQ